MALSRRDQAGLLRPVGLVGEPAAAVNDPIGEAGHAPPPGRRVDEPGRDLELEPPDEREQVGLLCG